MFFILSQVWAKERGPIVILHFGIQMLYHQAAKTLW